jgi:hypothetical protein
MRLGWLARAAFVFFDIPPRAFLREPLCPLRSAFADSHQIFAFYSPYGILLTKHRVVETGTVENKLIVDAFSIAVLMFAQPD